MSGSSPLPGPLPEFLRSLFYLSSEQRLINEPEQGKPQKKVQGEVLTVAEEIFDEIQPREYNDHAGDCIREADSE